MKKQLFLALIPLVLFWIIEEFYGLKAALVVGCVAAVIEVVWERWAKGKVSFMTWSANGLVLGLGAVSYVMDSGIAFKLQPAVMELAMAVMMLSVRWKGGESFMTRSFKAAPVPDTTKRDTLLQLDWFKTRLLAMDTRMIWFLVIHGLVLGWAAVWGSTRLWILLKGVLFYVLLVLIMVPMYKRPRENVLH